MLITSWHFVSIGAVSIQLRFIEIHMEKSEIIVNRELVPVILLL